MLSASQTVWKRHRFLPRICVTVQQTDENEPFYGLLIESRCTGFIKIFMVGGTGCLRGLVMGWVSSLFAASHPAPGRSNWKQMSEPSPVGCAASAGGLVLLLVGSLLFYLWSLHPWKQWASLGEMLPWNQVGNLGEGRAKGIFPPFCGQKAEFPLFFFFLVCFWFVVILSFWVIICVLVSELLIDQIPSLFFAAK